MNNYDVSINFKNIMKELCEIRKMLDVVFSESIKHDDLWDNSDIIRKWKVSSRTLSQWRKKGLISYVKIQSKMWYPKEARDAFIRNNIVPPLNSEEPLWESDGKGLFCPPEKENFIYLINRVD
jgi:hypothetical protein